MTTDADPRAERLRQLEEEVERHGCVRPPWIRFPGAHPLDIAWRMGAGEMHVMSWTEWASTRAPDERLAVLRRYGAVPADWAWWAAESVGLLTHLDDDDDLYGIPFEDIRTRLEALGVTVEGEPEV